MILTSVVFTGAFLMAVARLGSLPALEQDKGSADTVGRVFALLDQAGLRRLLHGLYDRLKRNKAVDLLDSRGRAYPGGPLSGDPDRSSTTDQTPETTTLSSKKASTRTVIDSGHDRRLIENKGFREMGTFRHADHIYRSFHFLKTRVAESLERFTLPVTLP